MTSVTMVHSMYNEQINYLYNLKQYCNNCYIWNLISTDNIN